MSSSSRDHEASGKLDAVFSCHRESRQNTFPEETEVPNRETVSRVVFILFLELLTQRKLENLFLFVTRIILLNQARSEFVKQEHQVGSLNNCIDELQMQAYAQRLELDDAHRKSSTTRRISYERKSSSRHSDSKCARDGRNEASSGEEFSVQKMNVMSPS